MVRRLAASILLLTCCLTLIVGCGAKQEEAPKYDLTFSDVEVTSNKNTSWFGFGSRYATFEVKANVKNTGDKAVGEDDMPAIEVADEAKTKFKPILSEKQLSPGDSCQINYSGRVDIDDGKAVTVAYVCELTFTGLDDSKTRLNEGIDKAVGEYADEDKASQERLDKANAEQAEKKKKEDEEKAKQEEQRAKEKEQAIKDLPNCVGKTAEEGYEMAKKADYRSKFLDKKGTELSYIWPVDELKNAKITAVDIQDEKLYVNVVFTLDYRDPRAQMYEDRYRENVDIGVTNTLTPENSEELAQLLNVSDPGDPLVATFADKHYGDAIRFNAVIRDVGQGSSSAKFNVLIGAGDDYDYASTHGPNFQFRDVSVNGLNISGGGADSIVPGARIVCEAYVTGYNDAQQLMFLEPIKTTLR